MSRTNGVEQKQNCVSALFFLVHGGAVGCFLHIFMCFDTEDDELVGTAARLLAQELSSGEAGRQARDGHVVVPPRLTVAVQHAQTSAAGAVPHGLLGPGRVEKNVTGQCHDRGVSWMDN